MRYASIPLEVLHSAAFRGAEPVDRATWVCLLAYCYEQESQGRIVGGRTWGDRRCQQILGVTRDEIDRYAAGLWVAEGDDLVVSHYDHAYVEQVRQNSRQGSAGGSATSEAKAAAARANGQKGGRPVVPRETLTIPNLNPNENPSDNPTTIPTDNPNNPTKPKLDGYDGRISRTDTPTPQPPAVAGEARAGERRPTKEENTAALERLLRKLIVATGPQATPRWAGLAEQAKVGSLDEALECVEWLITTARGQGVKVEYASDVLPFLERWKWHKAEQRRKAKIQAGAESSEAVAS